MTITNQDIPTDSDDEYVAGDTAIINDTIQKDDGSPKNISGATVRFGLAPYRGAPTIVEKDSSGNKVTIIDAQGGKVRVELVPSDTEGLGSPEGEDYHYEIEAEDPGTEDGIGTATTGTWTIRADTV